MGKSLTNFGYSASNGRRLFCSSCRKCLRMHQKKFLRALCVSDYDFCTTIQSLLQLLARPHVDLFQSWATISYSSERNKKKRQKDLGNNRTLQLDPGMRRTQCWILEPRESLPMNRRVRAREKTGALAYLTVCIGFSFRHENHDEEEEDGKRNLKSRLLIHSGKCLHMMGMKEEHRRQGSLRKYRIIDWEGRNGNRSDSTALGAVALICSR